MKNDQLGEKIMSKWDEKGIELVELLKGVSDEKSIQEISTAIIDEILESYPNSNSRKRPLTQVRKAVSDAYPDTEKQEYPFQYFTSKGKGNIERWQHLAFKYLTFSSEEWDFLGSDDRQEWKQAKPVEKTKIVEESKPVEETKPVKETKKGTGKTMTINQLKLDVETQKKVEKAIALKDMCVEDFVKKACEIYANTIIGKNETISQELSEITTEDLKSDKYKTHPHRAEEMVKRSIVAVENFNNSCTEKEQKWHINQTAIQELTGSKAKTVGEILKKYQVRIDDHNSKHELTPYDNRKKDKRQIKDVIDLIELVPTGIDLN